MNKLKPVMTPPEFAGTYVVVFRDGTEEQCQYSVFSKHWDTRRTDMIHWRVRDERDQMVPPAPTNEELCERVEDTLVTLLRHRTYIVGHDMVMDIYEAVGENPNSFELARVIRNVNQRLSHYTVEGY